MGVGCAPPDLLAGLGLPIRSAFEPARRRVIRGRVLHIGGERLEVPTLQARGELERARDDELALAVEGDEVVAVVEHDGFSETAQAALQVMQVAQARPVVLAWVDDERRLAHRADLLPDALYEPAQLQ